MLGPPLYVAPLFAELHWLPLIQVTDIGLKSSPHCHYVINVYLMGF